MISFIVPAYNEEKFIGATLESIFASARAVGEEFEVIVVNDASTDKTAQLARDCGARVIDVHKRQIAAVRNSGAKEARGEVLFFVDADTLVPEGSIRAALAAIKAGAIGGGARVKISDPLQLRYRIFMVVFSFFYFSIARLAAGCFVFMRKDVFDKTCGFDERYYASEEVHLSRALKRLGRFVIVREAVLTSGRKAKQYSLGQQLKLFFTLLLKGPRYLMKREGLDFWYKRLD
ncbi:MAG TPA: glycosyltransferase [Planctomycetota bacterium]|nr:glycosyltransferase [Planctomycetota bacterium]